MPSNNDIKALKSGVWYTAGSFLVKGIGFLTTPLFTRLLSHDDYGLYSNYTSWLTTFGVFATLSLGTSFISARFDHEKDFDGYISSVLVLSTIITLFWALIINLFPSFFSSLTTLEMKYLNTMVVYYLLYTAVDMFQARERYFYGYKKSVMISLLIAVSTALLSVLLVINLENKLLGRIAGSVIPTVLVGIVLYAILLIHGKKVKIQYWRYALPICLPFIPHVLSLTLLNSMDKMMITKMRGAEENALYSVAYSCGAIISLLISSLNTAISPWLGEKLNDRKYEEIRKVSKYYIILFVYVACGIMLITPELLWVMGGKSYLEAIYVMPPVTFGCVCQFIYTLYVNVEQFCKKTIGMACASAVAALSNYILNSIFIPKHGYIAAAYTTLASFMILLFIHMQLVKQIGYQKTYPDKLIIMILGFMSIYTALVHLLYAHSIIRYSALSAYIVITAVVAMKEKKILFGLLKKKT